MSIITHNGHAHRDEILATAIILANEPTISLVYRREPTQDEINNPKIFVVDIGNQSNSKLRNFDHHQDGNLEASFVQVLKYYGLINDVDSAPGWIKYSSVWDTQGPNAAEKLLNSTLERDRLSPIEASLTKLFGMFSRIPAPFVEILREIGTDIVNTLASRKHAIMKYENIVKTHVYNDFYVAVVDDPEMVDCPHIHEYLDMLEAKLQKPVAIVVMPDKDRNTGDPNGGYAFVRRNDHPAVDFNRCKDIDALQKDIVFIHNNGFILKSNTMYDPMRFINAAVK